MKVIEKKEFETQLFEVRRLYNKIDNEYTKFLKFSETNGEADSEKAQLIIEDINSSLKVIASLSEPLNRVKSIKMELEKVTKEFEENEEEFSNMGLGFPEVWNCRHKSDEEVTEYCKKLGEVAKKREILDEESKKIKNIISFLESEINDGRLLELNGIKNYYEKTLMSLNIINNNTNNNTNNNIQNEEVSENTDTASTENPEERSTVDEVINNLNTKLNLLEREDSPEGEPVAFYDEEVRRKKKGFFSHFKK